MERFTYTVSQVNEAIRTALQGSFPREVWVNGEIQGIDRNYRRRHLYFQLVQKATTEDGLIAKIECTLFEGLKKSVMKRAKDAGFELRDGLQVNFLARVDFWVNGGKCQLIIRDIDPEHTIGALALRKEAIIQALKKKGLFDRNRRVPLPEIPLHVGVITSVGSAAYNDFVDELEGSGYGFRVRVFGAVVQGEGTQQAVCNGIRTLQEDPDVELIVITRGGGSKTDLQWFDNQGIAEAIALCPKPVVTGIGHEIDVSIADMVAAQHLKTPTAVAQFLAEKVMSFVERYGTMLESIFERSQRFVKQRDETLRLLAHGLFKRAVGLSREQIVGLKEKEKDLQVVCQRRLYGHQCRIHEVKEVFLRGVASFFRRAEGRFLAMKGAVRTGLLLYRVAVERKRIVAAAEALPSSVENYMNRRRESLSLMARLLQGYSPSQLLRRGYTISQDGRGRTIRSAAQLKKNDQIRTLFWDGEADSVIIEKKSYKSEDL